MLSQNAQNGSKCLLQRVYKRIEARRVSKLRYLHSQHQFVDSMLRACERTVNLDDGTISKIEISQLGANKPIEDFFSAAKCMASNAYLLGVFDGHGGAACARYVCTRLFDYVCAAALEKHKVKTSPGSSQVHWLLSSLEDDGLENSEAHVHEQNIRNFHESIQASSELGTVRRNTQSAFLALDQAISDGAMPDARGQVSRLGVSQAVSGSCALMGHIRGNNLHVAISGDSAGVLGVAADSSTTLSRYEAPINGRQLTRPHTVENVDEVSRLQLAHPAETNSMVRNGRLLGELYPLRAFGDVRYKWPASLQRIVLKPLGIPPPSHLLTPPYLTAQPEVFYHRLTTSDRFLVLATDGLWEFLDPDTAVRLIHDHELGAQTQGVFEPMGDQALADVSAALEQRRRGERKRPLDSNSATHVIRNALGGVSGGVEQQYARLAETLQLPAGSARRYRDDITVMVVHFNSEAIAALNATSSPTPSTQQHS